MPSNSICLAGRVGWSLLANTTVIGNFSLGLLSEAIFSKWNVTHSPSRKLLLLNLFGE